LESWPSVFLFAAAQLKSAELSPFEFIERITFIDAVIHVGMILFIFFLKRGLAWLDDRFLITYTGHVPTYGTLGNAFLELQALAQIAGSDPPHLSEAAHNYVCENQRAGTWAVVYPLCPPKN
jgi:hypothetical protein